MIISEYIPRVVKIGHVPMGGDFPIRVQSMTTTNTLDTRATVEQAIRMIEAGCEYVRITAQGIKEAEHLAVIKKTLKKQGYTTPLIADVHFNPKAAEAAARIVEKVRINPGNYTDRKKGKLFYSDKEYAAEIENIGNKIRPLIKICLQYGTAIRIGSNHGSLSERILMQFGDTPAGMVESALEFVRICREMNFHNLVLSMKASNVKVMIQANRLLVRRMIEENMDYPIHLGVTEAGDSEDGRIKSSAGIGPLLMDGIGDTIRISLTEDPELEMPAALHLVSMFNDGDKRRKIGIQNITFTEPINYQRRITNPVGKIGNCQVPVVIINAEDSEMKAANFEKDIIPDFFYDRNKRYLQETGLTGEKSAISSFNGNFVYIDSLETLKKALFTIKENTVVILSSNQDNFVPIVSEIFQMLKQEGINQPVILCRSYNDIPDKQLLIRAASDFAYFLVEDLIDGIWIDHRSTNLAFISRIAFGILQATGSRISKTEYISCPACGRTLFNIQETIRNIKSKTSHLTGLKIGVMGCCVNGPGEMADADYGYVGSGKGKITLYKGPEVIKTGIPEQRALDSLIELIKQNGDWK